MTWPQSMGMQAILLKGVLLGVSSGAACLSMCTPVLVPYLLGEGRGVIRSAIGVGQFLLGRLLGYLAFGVLSWGIGAALFRTAGTRELIVGFSYVALSVLLVLYSLGRVKPMCAAPAAVGQGNGPMSAFLADLRRALPVIFIFTAGLLTGLNICPPFLLAMAGAADTGSLWGSLMFFVAFFAGTSLFFVPTPFVGLLRRASVLALIGRMAAGIMGLYYAASGILYLVEGISR